MTSPANATSNKVVGKLSLDRPMIRVLALSRKNRAETMAPTFKLRVELLIPELRELGIDVSVKQFPTNSREKRALLQTLGSYDAIWLHRHISWPWEIAKLRSKCQHLLFDYDDPVGTRPDDSKGISWTRALKFRSTLWQCSAVLAATDRLAELARPFVGEVWDLPLAIEPGWIAAQPRRREPNEDLKLYWFGSPGTFKYLEGISPALEAVGKACPAARLIVVGHQQLKLKHLRVDNIAWSQQAEDDGLCSSHVGLVPLPDTAWAWGKATLKPIRYMAAGMTFVGSPVGVNCRLSQSGQAALLASSPDDWVSAIQRLERDESYRLKLAETALREVSTRHHPQALAQEFERNIRRLLKPSAARLRA